MCEYGFSENDDFRTVSQKRLTAQGNESTFLDHELTIEMAKQLCMLARNDKGKHESILFKLNGIGIVQKKSWGER